MIRIKYHGNLGNHLLQYAFAKILSVELKQYLPPSKINFFPYTDQEFYVENRNDRKDACITLRGKNYIDVNAVKKSLEETGRKNIRLRSSCANYKNFVNYRNEIRDEWFKIDQPYDKNRISETVEDRLFVKENGVLKPIKIDKLEDGDVIVNVRLGDIEMAHRDRLLTIDYFRIIFDNIKINRLFLAPETLTSPLVLPFDDYKPIYFIQKHYMDTFNFVRLFDRIVISQSSFCWWESYLSDAKEIYYPVVQLGPWVIRQDRDEDLRVNEDRYIYVSDKQKKILGNYNEIKLWE